VNAEPLPWLNSVLCIHSLITSGMRSALVQSSSAPAQNGFSPRKRPTLVATSWNEKNMFEDTLLESGGSGGAQRRGAITLVALALECLAVGLLSLLALRYPHVAPKREPVVRLVAPPPSALLPPAARAVKPLQTAAVHKVVPALNQELHAPTKIPTRTLPEEAPPPVIGGVAGGVPGGVPGGQLGGILGAGPSLPAPTPSPQPTHAHRVQVSEGVLLHKVLPSYPALARKEHISGSVVLQAVIGKDGSVEDVRAVQGHPLLIAAATDAVKQWRYKPYLLNGRPVEVETTITVNFNSTQG